MSVVVTALASAPGRRTNVDIESGPAVVLRLLDSAAFLAAMPRRSTQVLGTV